MSDLEHLLADEIRKITDSKVKTFQELVSIANLDPGSDFMYCDLRGIDLRGTDLSKFRFAGSNLEDCIVSPEDMYLKAFDYALVDFYEKPDVFKDIENWPMTVLQRIASSLNMSFEDLTLELIEDVTTLDLRSLELTFLPDFFGYLPNLESLQLKDNKLTDLPSSLFQLEQLVSLDLFGNSFKTFSTELSGLRNLEYFLADGNPLAEFPEILFELKSLNFLSLAFCKLDTIPASLAEMEQLTQLYLEGNEFSELPDLSPLESLETLWISGGLTMIPNFVYGLDYLSDLSIGGELTVTQKSLSNIPNLVNLTITDQKGPLVNKIIEDLADLAQLESLTISLCPDLDNLTAAIGSFPDLRLLDINLSGLTTLPPAIVHLQNLRKLVLRFNELTTLPEEIAQLPNLTHLDISRNKFKDLPSFVGDLQESVNIVWVPQ